MSIAKGCLTKTNASFSCWEKCYTKTRDTLLLNPKNIMNTLKETHECSARQDIQDAIRKKNKDIKLFNELKNGFQKTHYFDHVSNYRYYSPFSLVCFKLMIDSPKDNPRKIVERTPKDWNRLNEFLHILQRLPVENITIFKNGTRKTYILTKKEVCEG